MLLGGWMWFWEGIAGECVRECGGPALPETESPPGAPGVNDKVEGVGEIQMFNYFKNKDILN